ncbi:unnamed protein product [Lasius platythorax]|uniref:Uncharacterized protein n=1 Tax=Lasius platythorax TaxID=488582 RepID=A0AAV2NDX2_9HYME
MDIFKRDHRLFRSKSMDRCDPSHEAALDEPIDRFTSARQRDAFCPPAATWVTFLQEMAVNEIPDSALIKANRKTVTGRATKYASEGRTLVAFICHKI